MTDETVKANDDADQPQSDPSPVSETQPQVTQDDAPAEYGGQKGPEPTRYGDWEKNGIISDF